MKKYFCQVKILSFKEYIFIFNQNIVVYLNFFISIPVFKYKNFFIQSKNAFNETFLCNNAL